jgi:beta-N-acetylhexosaminidase
MLDLEGIELTEEEKELLQNPLVGGIILFTRNFSSVEQIHKLVKAIHAVREPRLLIGVDHEGGRVQRFRDGFSSIPAARHFGEVYDKDPRKGIMLAEKAGWLMAAELRAVEIDFSFAPVLDVDAGVSKVIGDRAFHTDEKVIVELAHAYMKGMNHAGMAATGKHFPGHGHVEADSHVDIPVDERDYNEIYARDIIPFKRMIHHGLAAIMPAHVIYPKVDKQPAGFSSIWLQEILRKRLGFQGVIFSDDLDMQGASVAGDSYTDRAVAALGAGCDMVLICNNRKGAIEILDNLPDNNDPVSHLRLARMHGLNKMSMKDLHANYEWKQSCQLLRQYQDDPTLQLEI